MAATNRSRNNSGNVSARANYNVNMNTKSSAGAVPSYSMITQIGPSNDQAIVIEAYDDITLKDYIFAVGKITDPANIRFASRISNNRICIYLANKQLVEQITLQHPKIIINNTSLEVRPLLTKNKRIILSNVSPVIPNHVIEENLLHYGIKLMSSISHIKAGITMPGFTHIMSFRRQVYIKPDDVDKLPDSLQIPYEGTNYWLYISSDTPSCFICKMEGHLAKQCKSKSDSNVSSLSTKSIQPEPVETSAPEQCNSTAQTLPLDLVVNKDIVTITPTPPVATASFETEAQAQGLPSFHPSVIDFPALPETSTLKRPITSSNNTTVADRDNQDLYTDTSSTKEISDGEVDDEVSKQGRKNNSQFKHITKKPKRSDKSPSIADQLFPLKKIMEETPDDYTLNFIQFKSFLENTMGAHDVTSVAQNYTNDLEGLLLTIRKLYPKIADRGMKNRLTRIEKKLLPSTNQIVQQSDIATTTRDSSITCTEGDKLNL